MSRTLAIAVARASLLSSRLVSDLLMSGLLLNSAVAIAQTAPPHRQLITEAIDEDKLVTLVGNTHPAARAQNDRGLVADSLPLDHIYLQLERAPELQKAADALIENLHDPASASYHQWLTADQVATQLGPAEPDVQAVSGWLAAHGFKVNYVYRANGVIDFSGTVAQVREAFHTEIHKLSVNGKPHIANMSDPQVPAALAPAVTGVVSLHDFLPHRQSRSRANYTFPCSYPGFDFCGVYPPTVQAVAPDDLYTIYNMRGAYDSGITGRGQTIVVLEDSDPYTTDDWYSFRDTFGLTQRFPQGSVTVVHPQPAGADGEGTLCADPGVNPNGDDFEVALDMEWASAAAPDAAIVVASCANTSANVNSGVLIALQNLLAGRDAPPAIVSNSYGGGESEDGASFNAYIKGLYQTAVLEGVSIFVSSGDGGADSDNVDHLAFEDPHGINAEGFASTPYNVAVGGTDFGDTYLNQNAAYWSSGNGTYFNSAKSYIPEIPWNDSCASELIAHYFGYATAYGLNGFCNSPLGEQRYIGVAGAIAASGGPSGCAYGSPSIPGVVSGTCRGYRKPSYQALVRGNPRDGLRDLPDISLFASDGFGPWGHSAVLCFSDPSNLGFPCVGTPDNWQFTGGTSLSTPLMAGIQALINQAAGNRQGNPNYVLYALGALQYDSPGAPDCDATLGNRSDPRCVFHDVTLGDIVVNCQPLTDSTGAVIGTFNCFLDGATNGVFSLSNTSYQPAFRAGPGWDFATGLGTPNVYNLVRAWPGSRLNKD